MPRLLKIYLIVTGVPALLALAFPGLVILGFFLVILPGVILMFAPTAFFWGCIYAAAFWLLRRVAGVRLAAISAFPIVAFVLWAIPQPSVQAARATMERYSLPSIAAETPIRPVGDIRLESGSPRLDRANRSSDGEKAYECDNRCLALLFEPGVRSVTIDSSADLTFEQFRDGTGSLSSRARTYRLKTRPDCGGNVYEPDLDAVRGYFGASHEDNRVMSANWKRRLSTEQCIVFEPAMARYDLLLRLGHWRPDGSGSRGRSNWSLFENETRAEFAEIRTGAGAPLMREFDLQTNSLTVPLVIGTDGGMENFHFGWDRRRLPKRPSVAPQKPYQQLDAALDVRRTSDRERALNEIRDALSAAVGSSSDPSGQGVLSAVTEYMQMLKDAGATSADRRLIEQLIMDPRLHDLEGAWVLPGILTVDELEALRPAVARKLGSLPATVEPGTGHLGNVLRKWPVGVFAVLGPEEERLVQDIARRRRANGLIVRLSDMGAPAAPVLAGIVEDHLRALSGFDRKDPGLSPAEKDHGYGAHRATIQAAVSGLCRLGPAAGGQLVRLLELESREPLLAKMAREWDRMMVRLGKPVEDVRKPENMSGTEERYQRDLRNFLKEPFDPDRRC